MPLVLEAMANWVSLSTFAFFPISRTPRPPSKTTLPPSISASPAPGMPRSRIELSTNPVSWAMRSLSSGCAFLPAKLSRA